MTTSDTLLALLDFADQTQPSPDVYPRQFSALIIMPRNCIISQNNPIANGHLVHQTSLHSSNQGHPFSGLYIIHQGHVISLARSSDKDYLHRSAAQAIISRPYGLMLVSMPENG